MSKLFSEDYSVLTPAYGRDYKSAKAVEADFNTNKDFVLQPQGCYINKEQIEIGTKLEMRYSKLQKVTIITVK